MCRWYHRAYTQNVHSVNSTKSGFIFTRDTITKAIRAFWAMSFSDCGERSKIEEAIRAFW